jgi:hypothetical protein
VIANLEDVLRQYTKPSSDAEEDRQDAAERLVRDSVATSAALKALGRNLEILPKGSYKNNTNVKLDSDVDIAVVSHEVFYPNYSALDDAGQKSLGITTPSSYLAPDTLRIELTKALTTEAGTPKVHAGTIAINVDAIKSRRTSLDAVPSHELRRYFYRQDRTIAFHTGNVVFSTSGARIENWPVQQYDNGVAKNKRTGGRYKQLVRVMKNVENVLVKAEKIEELASYFIECLVYNVPDPEFGSDKLTDDTRNVIVAIYQATKTADTCKKWIEVNGLKWLFRSGQSWTPDQAKGFAQAAWNYLGFSA